MGVGLYLKPVNKDGRSLIYLRAKKGTKVFQKSTSITIKPSDWLARNYQAKGTALNSIIINRKLIEITNNMNLAWSLFENDSYTWDELCRRLNDAPVVVLEEGHVPQIGLLALLCGQLFKK